jgi:hypothetical protein
MLEIKQVKIQLFHLTKVARCAIISHALGACMKYKSFVQALLCRIIGYRLNELKTAERCFRYDNFK